MEAPANMPAAKTPAEPIQLWNERLASGVFSASALSGAMSPSSSDFKLSPDAGLDPWTLAAFATAPQPELGDRTPVDSFADPDPEPLLLSARHTQSPFQLYR